MEPSANEVFAGRYRFVDPLGAGGMGTVWRVWDHRTARYLAAKVLREQDAGALLRFVREQSLRVRHPHVVAPLGWAADDERVLLTMDLVRGGSVHGLVRDHGALPASFVTVLLDQLLSALEAVHDKGIVHRDVKPANLLLEATGRGGPVLRLADFGIATTADEPRLTRYGMVVGTPGYVAPEVLRGAEPEPRQDLYLAGLVAVEMLTGVRRAGAERPPGVPDPVWTVVTRLRAESPEDRPSTARAARRELAECVAELTVPTAAGPDPDAVEVFDQVAPLPAGFGPDGPLSAEDVTASHGVTLPVPPPTRRDHGAAPPVPPRPDRAATRNAPERDAGPGRAGPGEPPVGAGDEPARPRPAGRLVLLVGAAVLVLGIGLLAVVLLSLDRGTPDRDAGTGPVGTAPSSPATGRAPATEAPPRPSAPSSTPAPPPSSTPAGSARVGEPCGVVEGLTDTATDGTVVTCRPDGGQLTWQAG